MRKMKTLVMAFAMLGCTVGAWAQEDGNYYLYDASTGLFLSHGDSWSTRAVLSAGGCPTTWNSTDKTLQFMDKATSNPYLFATNEGTTYTDNSTNNQWEFVSVDGGYKLKNVAKGSFIGRTTPQYTTQYDYALTQTTSEDDAVVWTLVSTADYKTKQTERVPSFIYKDVITKAGLTCTADDFLTTLAGDDYKATDVTARVATSAITQSEWTVTGTTPGNWAGCESYQGSGFITRTVTGLPAGIYKVSLNGFERYSSFATCNTSGESGIEIATSFLRANSSSVPLKSWYSDRTDTSNPNSVADALAKFSAGSYANEVYCYVGDDGQLQLSVNYMSKYGSGRWVIFNNLKVTYYASLAGFNSALKIATDTKANELYANVTGKELADLTALIDKYQTTPDDIATAVTELTTATQTFTSAKDAYDALAAENAKAKALGAEEFTVTATTTKDGAIEAIKTVKVNEYNAVKNNYTYSVQLGEWTTSGPVGTMTSQHWDGTSTSSYCEQSNTAYSQSSWDITYTQDVTLPAGDYVFKMTGRHGSGSNTMELIVKDGETTIGTVNDFPTGDTGLGVNKNGETSFDASDAAGFANNGSGRGWEWRYVPFTLAEAKTVTITIHAAATAKKQWCSFCNYTVEAKPTFEDVTFDENKDYVPNEVKFANVTFNRTFVEGWNGLVLPFDMSIDDAKSIFNASAVKSFSGISVSDTGTTLKFEDATSIKAAVPFMIKIAAAPTSNTYTINEVFLPTTAVNSDSTRPSYSDGDVTYTFDGTYATTGESTLEGINFTLIQGTHFYNYDESETVKVKAFRAYFVNDSEEGEDLTPAGSKVCGFNFGDDDSTTDITEVKGAESKQSDKIYDLQGRMVTHPVKGIYIKNGKKVIVK